MTEAFTGTQVRAAETPLLEAGRGPELMARAAHGLALAVVRLIQREGGRAAGSRVAALVGKGNNGGDALFALAELARRGARTTAVLTGGRAHPAGLEAFARAGGRTTERLEAADLVVDAVLGTGFSASTRPRSRARTRSWWPATSPPASTRTPARPVPACGGPTSR
jgi:NAD(P)H-hydrate repair Nnr-like enzyme with NAD(P)H-hydrate epimerase domain